MIGKNFHFFINSLMSAGKAPRKLHFTMNVMESVFHRSWSSIASLLALVFDHFQLANRIPIPLSSSIPPFATPLPPKSFQTSVNFHLSPPASSLSFPNWEWENCQNGERGDNFPLVWRQNVKQLRSYCIGANSLRVSQDQFMKHFWWFDIASQTCSSEITELRWWSRKWHILSSICRGLLKPAIWANSFLTFMLIPWVKCKVTL